MNGWERWEAEWRRVGAAETAGWTAVQRIAQRRRMLLVHRLIEGGIAAAAILVTAAALWHAANRLEAALGLVVGISIAGLWLEHIRLRTAEDSRVAGSSPSHVDVLTGVRRHQVRLARFIWIVLALELVFLTPWWVIGSRFHHRSLVDSGSWLTVWLPIVGMIALFVWSWRLGRRARAELRALERLRAEFQDTA